MTHTVPIDDSLPGQPLTAHHGGPDRDGAPVTPAQIRGARALLDWSMTDLSRAARVSVSTVKRVEDGGQAAVSPATMGMIRAAFEGEGVRFLPDDGTGPGLRARSR